VSRRSSTARSAWAFRFAISGLLFITALPPELSRCCTTARTRAPAGGVHLDGGRTLRNFWWWGAAPAACGAHSPLRVGATGERHRLAGHQPTPKTFSAVLACVAADTRRLHAPLHCALPTDLRCSGRLAPYLPLQTSRGLFVTWDFAGSGALCCTNSEQGDAPGAPPASLPLHTCTFYPVHSTWEVYATAFTACYLPTWYGRAVSLYTLPL